MFTLHCCSSLSCMNEHLAIDTGECLCTDNICTLIAAWLNASERSWVGIPLNSSPMEHSKVIHWTLPYKNSTSPLLLAGPRHPSSLPVLCLPAQGPGRQQGVLPTPRPDAQPWHPRDRHAADGEHAEQGPAAPPGRWEWPRHSQAVLCRVQQCTHYQGRTHGQSNLITLDLRFTGRFSLIWGIVWKIQEELCQCG